MIFLCNNDNWIVYKILLEYKVVLFVLLSLCCPSIRHSEEVSHPKTINIKQYLNKNHFSVYNRHLVINTNFAHNTFDMWQLGSSLDITYAFTTDPCSVNFIIFSCLVITYPDLSRGLSKFHCISYTKYCLITCFSEVNSWRIDLYFKQQ
jgi:hypothetical protein